MAPPRLVVATRNEHKLRELAQILTGVELVSLPDDVELPPETGRTFAANALVKARTAKVATGAPAIADDSGIEAAALGGRPGVLSARYAGENATDTENLALLIRELREVEDRVGCIRLRARLRGCGRGGAPLRGPLRGRACARSSRR